MDTKEEMQMQTVQLNEQTEVFNQLTDQSIVLVGSTNHIPIMENVCIDNASLRLVKSH